MPQFVSTPKANMHELTLLEVVFRIDQLNKTKGFATYIKRMQLVGIIMINDIC